MSNEAHLSLGEFLRQERERRGITLEQVASATKIGVKNLHALEADHYVELPAKPFIRGFVNSYCRFIGLDSKEVLTRFGKFIDSKAADRPNREGGHSGYAFEKREGEQSRTVLWVVMGTFMIAGGLAGVFVKKGSGHRRHSHAEKLRATYSATPAPGASLVPAVSVVASPMPHASVVPAVAQVPVPSATPSPEPTAKPSPTPTPTKVEATPPPKPETTPVPTATPAAAAATEADEKDPLNSGVTLKGSEIKHRVVFKANESAWVRYQCDNRPVTQFVFGKGKALVLRARDTIRFQVAPPKAVVFNYRGSGYKPILGDQHVVTRQGDATLVFPFEVTETIKEPFPGEKPLAGRWLPAPTASPSTPASE